MKKAGIQANPPPKIVHGQLPWAEGNTGCAVYIAVSEGGERYDNLVFTIDGLMDKVYVGPCDFADKDLKSFGLLE